MDGKRAALNNYERDAIVILVAASLALMATNRCVPSRINALLAQIHFG